MNDVNIYLTKIKNSLFLFLLIFFCFLGTVHIINAFYNIGIMDLPKVIQEFDDEQLDKLSRLYRFSEFLIVPIVSAFLIIPIVILTYVQLYKEKLIGLYLLFFIELLYAAFCFSVGWVNINTPSNEVFGAVFGVLTYGIAAVVAIKLLLNHNFDMSTVRRKIGSSGLIFEDVYRLAEQGNIEAQINLGSLYFKGLGVLQDFPQAHMWYNLASATGNIWAAKNREMVSKKMTAQQVAEAQELAKKFQAKQV